MDSGAILTSIIGASIATIGLAVGKDSKVSEFRQQWIDALRADIAKYCSVSLALYKANVAYSLKERMELDIKHGASDHLVDEANDLKFRIRLRLDSSKSKSSDLREVMDVLTGIASTATKTAYEVDLVIEKVLSTTELILDEAWIKVRRGERRFRWTNRSAIVILVGSVALLVHHWWINGHRF